MIYSIIFFFSSRRRHTRCSRDWSSDVCSSDLVCDVAYPLLGVAQYLAVQRAEAAEGGSDVANMGSGIGIGAGGRDRLELDRGAVAGASVVVLTYLFPSQAQPLEDMVDAQANAGPAGVHPAV